MSVYQNTSKLNHFFYLYPPEDLLFITDILINGHVADGRHHLIKKEYAAKRSQNSIHQMCTGGKNEHSNRKMG